MFIVGMFLLKQMEGAARFEEAFAKGQTTLIVVLAFAEAVCVYGLISPLMGAPLVVGYGLIVSGALVDLSGTLVLEAARVTFIEPSTIEIRAAVESVIPSQDRVVLLGVDVLTTGLTILSDERDGLMDFSVTDITAGDWLIVVALLEIEVLMQLKGALTRNLLKIGKFLKSILYAVLFGCAVYWGIDGDFLDFWDAFLWLVAFIFIELNIFEWNAETTEAAAAGG